MLKEYDVIKTSSKGLTSVKKIAAKFKARFSLKT